MIDLTSKEKEVLILLNVERFTKAEVADKLNYSIRHIQRLKRSAESKIVNNYIFSINEITKS